VTVRFGIISVDDSRVNRKIVRITNILGQDVDTTYQGVVFLQYDDGVIIKKVN